MHYFWHTYFWYWCDLSEPWQIRLQDPATAIMEWMTNFHDLLVIVMVLILTIVCTILFTILKNNALFEENLNEVNTYLGSSNRFFSHSQALEIGWTIAPAIFLLIISFPSFMLLYALDDLTTPILTISIIGHQWYWSYEYCLGVESKITFDSYMLSEDSLAWGQARLLEVDNRLVLPAFLPLRLLITSSDVIHSWTIPSFGLKVDACPGRLTQASLLLKRVGTFYGQCSEICGINHGFMPIVVESVLPNIFSTLLKSFTEQTAMEYLEYRFSKYIADSLNEAHSKCLLESVIENNTTGEASSFEESSTPSATDEVEVPSSSFEESSTPSATDEVEVPSSSFEESPAPVATNEVEVPSSSFEESPAPVATNEVEVPSSSFEESPAPLATTEVELPSSSFEESPAPVANNDIEVCSTSVDLINSTLNSDSNFTIPNESHLDIISPTVTSSLEANPSADIINNKTSEGSDTII